MSTVLRKRVDPKPQKKLGATRLSALDDKENKPPAPVGKCKTGERQGRCATDGGRLGDT